MRVIDNKEELQDFLSEREGITVYGARYNLRLFLEALNILGYSSSYVKEILVTDMAGNPEYVDHIPVHAYRKENFKEGESFFLTLAEDYISDVSKRLEEDGFFVVRMTERLLNSEIVTYDYIYSDVCHMMADFTNSFSNNCAGFNEPVPGGKKYAWSCWWQGMEQAPNLIRACINSQKRYLPDEVELVVITEDNYCDYVDFPQWLIDKVEDGRVTLTTFSDVIRASLLYKYGGIWLDSTILLTETLPIDFWEYEIFTIREFRYCLPFMGGKPGQKFYRFLMEGFFYYYKNYGRTKYYLLVTYLLDIAMNTYPDIRETYDKLPEKSPGISNIDNFDSLSYHMHEKYSPEVYHKYMEGIYVHKLQRRFDRFGESINDADNIYHYILSEFL
ncbi:MAG: capsular polysaccharide synthesis protein [Lachnospiraceae bacterium]|nr:capsular polysaccharide synthesis protein [Lachnospiraceae bacterium]